MGAAQMRREQELRQLVVDGVPLSLVKSGHWMIGSLHLFTASGRWLNEETGGRDRLHTCSMKEIVEREYYDRLGRRSAAAGSGSS
jgi:hypothetical protein